MLLSAPYFSSALADAVDEDEIKLTTAADGSFKVTWPEAGMYWLEASITDAKTSVPQAKQRRLMYVATLEVLPQ